MGWLDRLETKSAGDDFIPADHRVPDRLPRTRYPYDRDVGIGLDSNVVMSPVNWVLRNFTEAESLVQRLVGNDWQPAPDHDLSMLLDTPNDFQDGDELWKATLVSYILDGNAYWLKVRNGFGNVIALWYIPHFLIEPRWPRDGQTFISHYEYRPEFRGTKIDLLPRDVVHFRFGLDPRNTRKGMSPVRNLLREVFTDDEAANFSASILRNMGVPGGVIAPKDGSILPSSEDVKEMKHYMKTAFTGDRRGDWLVLGTPTETSQFGFNPQNLMLGNLRDVAEERVCAAIGVPAAVVGFGTGLQQTKVGATMKEMRRLAWVSCIIPMQNSLARQLTRQAMPDFQSQVRRFRVKFDTSHVSAFLEEETERADRVGSLVVRGILRVDKAQEELGLEVDPSQAIYLRPQSVVPVPVGEERADPPAPSSNGNSRNGSGGDAVMRRAQAALASIKEKGG